MRNMLKRKVIEEKGKGVEPERMSRVVSEDKEQRGSD